MAVFMKIWALLGLLAVQAVWGYLETQHFVFVNDRPSTWADAEKFCQSEFNSHLATITSDAENTEAFELRKKANGLGLHVWIGLNDIAGKHAGAGAFEWASGSNSGFRKFSPGEPNNGGEECVHFWANRNDWNDLNCGAKLGFLCDREGRDHARSANYIFVDLASNYDDAEKYCVDKFGSHLATIFNDANEDEAQKLKNDNGKQHCWIGLNDLAGKHAGNDGFDWKSGCKSDYRNWAPGEPNNGGEECVHFWGQRDDWNDLGCGGKLRFICDAVNLPPMATSDHFVYVRDGRAYADAETFCKKTLGTNLATISSEELNKEASNLRNANGGGHAWIGLNDIAGKHAGAGVFVWSSGSKSEFRKFAPGEPNNGGEECVHLLNSREDWNDLNCASKMPFVCDRDPYEDEDIYYEKPVYSDHFIFVKSNADFMSGEKYCQEHFGTHLATITNDHLNEEAAALYIAAGNPDTWIGLNNYEDKGSWDWISGDHSNYRAWDQGQPNDARNEEDCVQFWREDSPKWHDVACYFPGSFICDRKEYPESVNFVLIDRKESTWEDAEEMCQNVFGTHLARVDSAMKNAELVELFTDNGLNKIWIGYSDKDHEGIFEWSDGSNNGWINWGENEPNNWGGGEDCAELLDGGAWNDLKCATKLPYACNKAHSSNECFIHVPQRMNAYDAQKYCQFHFDTDLASICNQDSQDKFNDLIEQSTPENSQFKGFIGLVDDPDGGGLFKWVDGSEVGYTNWATGNPSNMWRTQYCAITSSIRNGANCLKEDESQNGLWDDVNCKVAYDGFTCNARQSECSCLVPEPILRWTMDDKWESIHGYKDKLALAMVGEGANLNDESYLRTTTSSYAWTAGTVMDAWNGDLVAKSYSAWVRLDNVEDQAWVFGLDRNYDPKSLKYTHAAFDSIGFSENTDHQWELGTEHNRRESPFGGPKESVKGEWLNLVMTFHPPHKNDEPGSVELYRNGEPYGSPFSKAGNPMGFPSTKTRAIFGYRHMGCNGEACKMNGDLDLIEVYNHALTERDARAIYARGRGIHKYGYPSNECYVIAPHSFNRGAAQAFCEQTWGTDLAIIPNGDAQKRLNALVNAQFSNEDSFGGWWIGLKDVLREGGDVDEWEWEDGSSSKQFTHWEDGRPLKNGNDELNGAAIFYDKKDNPDLKWRDTRMSDVMPGVACNVPNTECESDHGYDRKGYPGHGRYIFVNDQKMDADEANKFCRDNWNTDLASVLSTLDQQRLTDLIDEVVRDEGGDGDQISNLIGLNDDNNDNIWEWRDGSPYSYSNFGFSKPGQCVVTSGDDEHRWTYEPCDTKFTEFTCNAPGTPKKDERRIAQRLSHLQFLAKQIENCPKECSEEHCLGDPSRVCSASIDMFVDPKGSGDACRSVYCRDCSSDLTSCVKACRAREDRFGDSLNCEVVCREQAVLSAYRCFNNYS